MRKYFEGGRVLNFRPAPAISPSEKFLSPVPQFLHLYNLELMDMNSKHPLRSRL